MFPAFSHHLMVSFGRHAKNNDWFCPRIFGVIALAMVISWLDLTSYSMYSVTTAGGWKCKVVAGALSKAGCPKQIQISNVTAGPAPSYLNSVIQASALSQALLSSLECHLTSATFCAHDWPDCSPLWFPKCGASYQIRSEPGLSLLPSRLSWVISSSTTTVTLSLQFPSRGKAFLLFWNLNIVPLTVTVIMSHYKTITFCSNESFNMHVSS